MASILGSSAWHFDVALDIDFISMIGSGYHSRKDHDSNTVQRYYCYRFQAQIKHTSTLLLLQVSETGAGAGSLRQQLTTNRKQPKALTLKTRSQPMTITHSVQQEFLDDESKNLICIPCRTSARSVDGRVTTGIGSHSSTNDAMNSSRKPPVSAMTMPQVKPLTLGSQERKGERWTEDEHERFLLGMEMFKAGPWKKIAGVVGTRDARQTMSHSQKYRQKIKRRKLGMQTLAGSQQIQPAECTDTTKKRRTMPALAAPSEERVAASTRQSHVSSTVQLAREDVDAELDVTSSAQGSEHGTGLIPAETVHTINLEVNANDPSGVMVSAGIERDDMPSRRLDATLEPLDILVDISVIHDSWLGPDELWGFLQR